MFISDKHRFIKKAANDTTFEGKEGETMWEFMIGYLEHLGSKQKFISFVTEALAVTVPKMTTVLTTLPTLSPDLEKTVVYIYEMLIPTFRNPEYRQRWLDSNRKGYDTFIKELIDLGPKHFLYMGEKADILKATQAGAIWEAIANLFKTLQQTGFEDFLDRMDKLPENYKYSDILMREPAFNRTTGN